MSVCNSLDELLSESNNNKDVFTAAITMEQGTKLFIQIIQFTIKRNPRISST